MQCYEQICRLAPRRPILAQSKA